MGFDSSVFIPVVVVQEKEMQYLVDNINSITSIEFTSATREGLLHFNNDVVLTII